MTVFLCGFMGCGKSTIGKELASATGSNFIDMDDYIREKAKMSIPEIFALKGEDYFRKLETRAVRDLSEQNSAVVACGGGAMLKKENSVMAREKGKVIYLELDFESCYERIKDDNNRPIVMNNTKEALHEIYDRRVPIYKENSDISVNVDSSPKVCAENIKKLVFHN